MKRTFMRVRVSFYILLLIFNLVLSIQTFPQIIISEKIQFNKIAGDQNVALNFIWCVFQDTKGFIWIGASEGLIRYDGLRFKSYKYSTNDTNSISANTVRVILEDKSGYLWIGTGGGGLNRYNPSKDNFTAYFHNNKDSTSLSHNYVYSIFEDRSGALWIGTESGLNVFNRDSEKFIRYKNIPGDSESLSSNIISSIFEDSDSNLWIGTIDGGLNKLDRGKNKFIRYTHNPFDPGSISHNKITQICKDNFGNIWISTLGGGINKLTKKDNNDSISFIQFKHNPKNPYSISSDDVASIYFDDNNVLWVGTWKGGLNRSIASLDENSTPAFISFTNDLNNPNSLKSNDVNFIYIDISDLLWVGTWGGGLYKSNLMQKQFGHYKNEPDNPFSLSANGVTVVRQDKYGIIWIGTWNGGLNKWDRTTDKFISYKHNPDNPYSLSENTVTVIHEDRDGIMWIGTWNGGLNKFERNNERFYNFRHNPNNPKSISDNRIVSITEDSSGTLWIGTYFGGLNKYNKESESFTHFSPNYGDKISLNLSDATDLLIDHLGIFWIGSKRSGGLYALDMSKEELIQYKNDPNNLNSLSNNKISELYEDKTGTFWVGTQDGGLNKFDRRTNKFKRYGTKDGLASEFVMGILEDDNGNLWISTKNGLSKFNIHSETFRNYYIEDGLQSNEFEEFSACCKLKTGELIFGGVNGFNIFYPDSIKDNTHIPPVYITDFHLFNKPVQIGYDSLNGRTIISKPIIECEEIELNYGDKVFSFEFAALDYHSPLKNKYAYIMEGFDKEWTYTEASKNTATYTNLDPGEYTFRVKGSNNDGYWNEQGGSIKVIILPPWWRTNLAYLIYFLLFGAIVSTTWQTQIKRIRNKHEFEMSKLKAQKLHEVDELKSRFFTNISHEFRTPLTLILGPAKDILESTKETKTKQNVSIIKRNAGKLIGLVNQLLDISKLESGNMKLSTSPRNIIPLLKGLVLSFTSYAERKRITLNFSSSENEIIVYLDHEKFEKVITNILSNAFKFTPEGGLIEVKVGKSETHLEIKVIDTGIGIPSDRIEKIFDRFYQVDGSHTREQEGTGIGLSLAKELIELHKGKISVESEPGKGSIFTISLPLGKEHLRPEEIYEADLVKAAEEDPPQSREYEEEIKLELIDELVTDNTNKQILEIELSDKPVLLIVEDNNDVRVYINENLKNDYKVIEAVDGEDGWNKSIEQLPDLIVSDVMMPRMDGFRLCEKLKTDERTSHIPVILLTAKAAKEDKLAGYETGADEYLMKPFDADELRARIKNLIQQRKRLHEYFRNQGFVGIEEQRIASVDKIFLKKCFNIVNKHISDSSFSVELLSDELAISRSGLQKKIQSLIGETPGELIRRIRLNKAAELISQKFGNLSEIALEVGYNNPAHFSEAFKRQFGVAPSQYLQNDRTL